MTRIGSYGANQMYLSRLSAVQQRLSLAQIQVTTEKKSVNYTGIASDTNRLINLENEKAQAANYTRNNDFASTRLGAAQISLTAAEKTMAQFRDRLDQFASGNTSDPANIQNLQEWAVRAMVDLQSYLNVSVDGQSIFSGGRVSTLPVDLPATTLTAFQAIYDGSNRTFPTTRAANLQDFSFTNAQTGNVTFDSAAGAIIAANAGAFKTVATGSLVSVGGTASNNQDVTITGHVATNVNSKPLTETANAGANTFITYPGGNLLNGATGNLAFAFDPSGNMTISPTTPNTLTDLTVGTKFTVKGSTDGDVDGYGDRDGAYVVTANANGVVTFANDTTKSDDETVTVAMLGLQEDGNADGVPETVTALGLASGNVTFTVSGNTVTMTVPPGGTDLTTLYAANDPITISGTSSHNGTFEVDSATATTLTFKINPDALRTSKFVPQTNRSDVNITFPGQSKIVDSVAYGSLTFTPNGAGGETITASNANVFRDTSGAISPIAGELITLASTSGVNDGIYKVVSNNGTNIVIESVTVTAEANVATATLSATSWYKGDTIGLQQRVDTDTTVDVALFASNPAFEKAFRAMGLIAQGALGTTGGLDNNQDRVGAARYLINDALTTPSSGTPPYGTEMVGNMEAIQSQVGVTQSTIKTHTDKHKQFMGFLDSRIIDMENVDKTEAIARLLDDQTALEASYKALSTVRSLSLVNYMK